MMKSFHLLQSLNSYLQELVGGPLMIAAVLLTGCYLTLRLQWPQLRYFTSMLRNTVFAIGQQGSGSGAISSFQALTTALAATIGTAHCRCSSSHNFRRTGAVFGCGLPSAWLLNTRVVLLCTIVTPGRRDGRWAYVF